MLEELQRCSKSILHVCGGDPNSKSYGEAKKWCILHVCGGDPKLKFKPKATWQYSPRMWR